MSPLKLLAGTVVSSVLLATSAWAEPTPTPSSAQQRESDRQGAREFARDAMITARVKTALLADKEVEGLQLNVDTKSGVVTLSGEVKVTAQAGRAGKIASEIEGVAAVNNGLVARANAADARVTAGQAPTGSERQGTGRVVDDGIITGKVKTALVADSEVKGLMIDVDTNRGIVTLSGQVESKAQLEKATSIARQTEGVSSVNNQLSVKNESKQRATEFQSDETSGARADLAQVQSELIAHRLFDSSPVARYRPLPPAILNAMPDSWMGPGSI